MLRASSDAAQGCAARVVPHKNNRGFAWAAAIPHPLFAAVASPLKLINR
jgi:hypothetical protein